ncbi:MAG: hypothetical protein C4318_08655 [Acidimicrobiia bacterium]
MNGRDLLVKAALIVVLFAAAGAGLVLQKPGTEGEIRGSSTAITTSSTWFCTGLAPRPGRTETIAISNPGAETLSGRLTISGLGKPIKTKSLEIPALTTASLDIGKEITPQTFPAVITDSQSAGVVAVVELDGPSAAVASASDVSTGPVTDVAASACATSLSDHLSIAGGSSVRGSNADFYLANPLGHDAVVDVALISEGGVDEPPKLQKLPVLSSSQAAYRISDESRRRWALAVEATATAGEVVGSVEVTSDGKKLGEGIARITGSAEQSSAWMFPAFSGSGGSKSILSVANPLAERRKVEVRIVPDDSVSPTSSELLSPRTFEVEGESAVTLTPAPGLGEGARYGIRVEAPDGKPILTAATLRPRPPGRGLGISGGHPRAYARWVMQEPEALGLPPGSRSFVSVMNVSDRDATLKVSAFGSGTVSTIPGLESLKIGQGRSLTLDFGSIQLPPGVRTVLVDSDIPVVAEATLLVGNDSAPRGFDVLPLIPLEIPKRTQPALSAEFSKAGLAVPGGASGIAFGVAFLAAAVLVVVLDRRANRRSAAANNEREGPRMVEGVGYLAPDVVLSLADRARQTSLSGAGRGASGTVLLLFSHEGCRVCLATRELLDAAAEEYGGAVVEVAYEEEPDLFESARIEDVPTTVLVKKGQLHSVWIGPLCRRDLVAALREDQQNPVRSV